MSLSFYKIFHIIGIIMLFTGIGGALVRAVLEDKAGKLEKFVLINHGIGLLLILVAGFGQLAKIGMELSGWLVIKIVIWLLMGALIMPIKKMPHKKSLWWFIALFMGSTAAYMGIFKPF